MRPGCIGVGLGILALLAATCFGQMAGSKDGKGEAGPVTLQPVAVPGMLPDQARAAQAMQQAAPPQRDAAELWPAQDGGWKPAGMAGMPKARPELQNLSPEEIAKGKELFEKKQNEPLKKHPDDAAKAVIEMPGKTVSLFDRYRVTGKYQTIATDLKPFGYEFFRNAAVAVETDRKDVPVPAQYVIGPGDEVKILLWGRVNGQYNLVVDRNGNITLPQLGPLRVAGLTFEQMAAFLIKQSEQIVGANVDIAMGALKSIAVFVLGDVKRPGAYTIGSFATIVDALLAAGGPSDIGSMRNIQLRRKEKIVTDLDLYDLLIKGDKSKDLMLQAGDVIFVPVTGPLVGVAGSVKRPAVYELREKNDLQSLLDLAGGIIPTAYTQQIQVERVKKNEKQIVVDIDDKELNSAKEFRLHDGDLVKIFPIVDRDANAVFLNGNVKRPGKYEYKPGMRLRDLVKGPDDLLQETYFDYGMIKRLAPPS